MALNETDRTALVTAIVEWLEQGRAAFLAAAQETGIPPSITVARPIVTIKDERSYETQEGVVAVTPLASLGLAIQIGEIARASLRIEDSPAAAIHEAYSDRCKAWYPVLQSAFEDDPVKWIHDVLLLRVQSDYFAELSSLETGDRESAEALAADFLSFVAAHEVDFVTALPVAGLRCAEDPIEFQNVRLRTLTPQELGDLGTSGPGDGWPSVSRHRKRVSARFPDVVSERAVLEVRTSCDKLTQPIADLQPQKVVLALELLGYELHGFGWATTWTQPGSPLWTGGQGFRLPRRGEVKECSLAELERAVRLAERIPDGAINSPTDTKQVALHRFQLGAAEDNPADELIDYVIALEGFLLPGKEGEYRFKFSLFGSWYLADTPGSRELIFKDLQAIYDTRSQVVHGGAPIPDASITDKAAKARELAARMLVKALEEGWPSHEALKKAALG